ncbi:UDP-N-acetylmuramoyl-L-alanyl-D-glutamate--2,6-diaminopimelate ligase [Hoeflea poritis]|uniref:Multifunctional fusion protein n=1 Tax=Hoeflea poritis TaxID=2993659 RepID=A0ABT4VP58_9HYPH|nr:UDP-N-acetylmuramoyl-L-alanyl-D-glutamate--2,6-diaminopimelate ligase [Hoeflea poritis]MDA4846497.1 UDP-N-acetylmuramoyl-L-alanyl-D-glutamate--2,6-diaminopimelate ligase [Hoeflea poritis]
MKLNELAADLATIPADLAELEITGLSADSRNVQPGHVFVAIAGQKQDGAQFLADAVQRGAVAAVAAAQAEFGSPGVPVIRVADPRLFLAKAAARFYGAQPETMVAVTGTAGKTSVASFTRQIWERAGLQAAMIGTTGVETPTRKQYGQLTTPDPMVLHRILSELADEGIAHCSMEASSHGLDQHRLDGVRLSAGAFTNLGRDHLDYHASMEEYFAAKMRLFEALLRPGAPAIIFADDTWSARVIERAGARGLEILTVGRKGDFLALKRVEHQRSQQIAEIHHGGAIYQVTLPLAGDFQLSNALVAAGLAIATGVPAGTAIEALEHLHGASGRLELVGTTQKGVPAYVDYAHKPEALEQVLQSVRPFTTGRVVVVFGCGGDRDRGKRPIMGEIATRLADLVVVTDDNPRSEDPAAIRAEILAEAPGALEIGDRAQAISDAVAMVAEGDTLVVAGKGHEEGQTVGDTVLPFSDHDEIRKAIARQAPREWLWTTADMVDAMKGRPVGDLPEGIDGISIDSRSIGPGEAFFAIKGDRFDGHDFASSAVASGAALLVVAESRLPALGRVRAPMIVVDDVLEAMARLGVAARARTKARIIAVTGSVGKTTTKEMLRHVLSAQGSVHASVASFNNHWGVPLTLARMPKDTAFGVFEIGMNHAGEIRPLVKMVRPHIAIVTAIAAAHLGNFKNISEIAAAKAEIFEGVELGGHALINRDSEKFAQLKKAAAACDIANVHAFGAHRQTDIKLVSWEPLENGSSAEFKILGETVAVSVGVPGHHVVQNALAVAGAAKLAGADLRTVVKSFADLSPAKGRGARHVLDAGRGTLTVIDDSYNANPASMRAGIALLRDTPLAEGGRRIAVLGDMLELGNSSKKLHAELRTPIVEAGIDLLLLGGPEMKALADTVGDAIACRHYETVEALEPALLETVRSGDVVLIKSSNGIGFSRLVSALVDKFPAVSDSGAGQKSREGVTA